MAVVLGLVADLLSKVVFLGAWSGGRAGVGAEMGVRDLDVEL